jgi:hypothetical protein
MHRPQMAPSARPSHYHPSAQPSRRPLMLDQAYGSQQPSVEPSRRPPEAPSAKPSPRTTAKPSRHPSAKPTRCPQKVPLAPPVRTPQLQQGDTAIIQYNSVDPPDNFCLLSRSLTYPPTNARTFFTDNGWVSASQCFQTGEGILLTWSNLSLVRDDAGRSWLAMG